MATYRSVAPELAVLESHVDEPYNLIAGSVKKDEKAQIGGDAFEKPSKYTGVFCVFPLDRGGDTTDKKSKDQDAEWDNGGDQGVGWTPDQGDGFTKNPAEGETAGWTQDQGDGFTQDPAEGETAGWTQDQGDGFTKNPAEGETAGWTQDQGDGFTQDLAEGETAGWTQDQGDGFTEDQGDGSTPADGADWQPDLGDNNATTSCGAASQSNPPAGDGEKKVRNPADRFRGVTFLRPVESKYAPPDSESYCAIGRMPPSKADRSKRGEKKPKEVVEFTTQHERESHFVRVKEEREQRAIRDKAWIAMSEQMREENEETGKVATFALKPMLAQKHDYRPHFECVFTFSWMEGEEKKVSRMVLYLWSRNTGTFTCSDMETDVPEKLQILPQALVLPGEGAKFFEAWYDPTMKDAVWAVNILGDGKFGPWQGHVDQLRRFVVHGGLIQCAVSNASGLPDEVDTLTREFAKARTVSPIGHFWTGKYRITNYGPKELAPRSTLNARTMKPRIAFPELIEKVTFELTGRARDNEWTQQLTRSAHMHLAARFIAVPGHTHMLWMFIAESSDHPLEIQSGDKIKVRIHKLNAANIPEEYWKGVAEPADSLFGATYRRFVIRQPMDKESDTWLGGDPALLESNGIPIPSLYECHDRTTAAQLLDNQKPRAVDIRLDDEGKSFKRAQTTVRAALEQVKREKEADPHGISVTEDLLLAARFDRLPAVDLLEQLTDEEYAVLLSKVGNQQGEVLRGVRNMGGGLALVQGCAGAGKTHIVLQVITALVGSLANRFRNELIAAAVDNVRKSADADAPGPSGKGVNKKKKSEKKSAKKKEREMDRKARRAAEAAAAAKAAAESSADGAGDHAAGKEESAGADASSVDDDHDGEESPKADAARADDNRGKDLPAYRPGLKAMIATPINSNAEHLMEDVRKELDAVVDDALVMRKYSKDTNRKLFTKAIDDMRYANRRKKTSFDYGKALSRMKTEYATAAAMASLREFRDRHARYFGADKRVTEEGYKHSAAAYVSYALGLELKPSDVNTAAVNRLKDAIPVKLRDQLRDAVDAYEDSEEERPSGASVSARFEAVLEIAFNTADCLIVSLQHAMDPGLFLYFRPEYVFIDEAAKADSADSLAWIWYPSSNKRVLVGDTMQSRPQMRAPPQITCFTPQLTLSYLAQAQIAGKETTYQVEQHRYGGEILKFISDVFYGGRLTVAPSAMQGLAPKIERFRKFAQGLYNVASNVVMVDIKVKDNEWDQSLHKEHKGAHGSRYNPCTSVQVSKTLDRLVAFGYNEKDLGVVTPYEAARNVHESLAASRQQAKDPNYTSEVMFETCERAQGLQREVLIFEIPNTDAIGFINSAPRLNTGLTRVAAGLIIITQYTTLESAVENIRSPLGAAINYCKKINCFVEQLAVSTSQDVWKHVPDYGREAPTDLPEDIVHPKAAKPLDPPQDDVKDKSDSAAGPKVAESLDDPQKDVQVKPKDGSSTEAKKDVGKSTAQGSDKATKDPQKDGQTKPKDGSSAEAKKDVGKSTAQGSGKAPKTTDEDDDDSSASGELDGDGHDEDYEYDC